MRMVYFFKINLVLELAIVIQSKQFNLHTCSASVCKLGIYVQMCDHNLCEDTYKNHNLNQVVVGQWQ